MRRAAVAVALALALAGCGAPEATDAPAAPTSPRTSERDLRVEVIEVNGVMRSCVVYDHRSGRGGGVSCDFDTRAAQ